MDYIELKCEITPYNEAIAQILISELGELGYDSFTENEDSVDAYITEDLFNIENSETLTSELAKMVSLP